MARGQSPYQGRYTVPIADFSPIAQSGRDIGAAFASIGSSVASGLTKRKEEKDALKAIEGKTKGLNTAIQGFGGLIDAGAFSDDEELNASLKQQIESLNNAINKNPDITPREKLGILEGGMPLLLKGLGLVTDKYKSDMENRPEVSVTDFIQPRQPSQPVAPQVRGDPAKVPSPEKDTGVRKHSIFDAMAKDRGGPLPVELDASAQLKLNAENDLAEQENARNAVSDMEAAMASGRVPGLSSTDKNLYDALRNKANTTTPNMAQFEAKRFVDDHPESAGATVTVSTDKTGNASWSATATYKGEEAMIKPVTFGTLQGNVNVPGLLKIEGHTGFFTTKDGKFVQVSDSSNSAVAIDSHRLALDAVLKERELMFPPVSNLDDDTDLTFEEFKQIYESSSKTTKDGIWTLVLVDDKGADKTIKIDTNTERYGEADKKYKEYREESEKLQKLTNLLGRTGRTEIPFAPNAIKESLDIKGGSSSPDSFDIEKARELINAGTIE